MRIFFYFFSVNIREIGSDMLPTEIPVFADFIKIKNIKEAVSKERSINRKGLKVLNPKIAKNSDTAIYLCVLCCNFAYSAVKKPFETASSVEIRFEMCQYIIIQPYPGLTIYYFIYPG